MHNPYAHTAAPRPETPEAQLKADYEAAIGPNTGYYLKYFEDLDAGGSKAGWHWPAFFVTTFWFIYRKMWLPGILNFFWPIIAIIIGGILMAVLGITAGIVIYLLLLAAPSILLPIYANAIYRRHIHQLVERLPAAVAAAPEKRVARLEREGGTSAGAVFGVVAAGLFFYVFIIGILAAIAIPAYQDYTIRSQVTEGLNLASPLKAAVAEFWAQHHRWPEPGRLRRRAAEREVCGVRQRRCRFGCHSIWRGGKQEYCQPAGRAVARRYGRWRHRLELWQRVITRRCRAGGRPLRQRHTK